MASLSEAKIHAEILRTAHLSLAKRNITFPFSQVTKIRVVCQNHLLGFILNQLIIILHIRLGIESRDIGITSLQAITSRAASYASRYYDSRNGLEKLI